MFQDLGHLPLSLMKQLHQFSQQPLIKTHLKVIMLLKFPLNDHKFLTAMTSVAPRQQPLHQWSITGHQRTASWEVSKTSFQSNEKNQHQISDLRDNKICSNLDLQASEETASCSTC